MPSDLVNGVRALLLEREEEGRRVTAAERAMILATLARYDRAGQDAVDELEAAIAHARRVCLTEPSAATAPTVVAQHRRDAVLRLLAAARGLLDFAPLPVADPEDDTATITAPADDLPRPRADVDG